MGMYSKYIWNILHNISFFPIEMYPQSIPSHMYMKEYLANNATQGPKLSHSHFEVFWAFLG